MYRGKRERTPLSPSPSPEPPGGVQGQDGAGAGTVAVGNNPTTGYRATSIGGLAGSPNDGMHDNAMADGAEGEENEQNRAQERARRILEDRIRIAVDDLMQLATCAAEVHEGDEDIVRLKINEMMESLQVLQDACNLPDLRHMIPEDVMSQIDMGRNPDLHTRTFTNRLNSDNQQMRGQAVNFDLYRGQLRDKLQQAFPEMEQDLQQVDQAAMR